MSDAIGQLRAAKDKAEEALKAAVVAAKVAEELHNQITAIYDGTDGGDSMAGLVDQVTNGYENTVYGTIQSVITMLDEAITQASAGKL